MELKKVDEITQEQVVCRLYEIGNYELQETIHEGLKPLYGVKFKNYKRASENYQPMIHFENSLFGKGKRQFVIQTTSHGSLEVEKVETMLVSYKEAVEIAKVLNSYIEQEGRIEH